MKTEIKQIEYNPNIKNTTLWWTWKEVCDDCGITIYKSGDRLASCTPDITKQDFCLNCIRKRIDELNNK